MSYNIPNTIFFRRDNSESQENMPESRFSHDLAFYYQTRVKSSDKTDRMGFFFRVDSESSGRHTIPEGNTDISIDGDHATPIDGFISTIGKYEEIHTDRLHVAIAAAIQGVKVNLYPGSYFKK
jgi:exopolysaccharide biosynthesis predicted pyruvyltransferase EpsI